LIVLGFTSEVPHEQSTITIADKKILSHNLYISPSYEKIKKALENPRPYKKSRWQLFGLPTALFAFSGHEQSRQTTLKKLKKEKNLSTCLRVISVLFQSIFFVFLMWAIYKFNPPLCQEKIKALRNKLRRIFNP
jgi:hypothetical protein